MILLTADWHLDDQPQNAYRWDIIGQVIKARAEHDIGQVYILGDLVDRKDRFSAAFVNRLLSDLQDIAPVTILRGNHDSGLRTPHYFDWLAGEFFGGDVSYITDPTDIFRIQREGGRVLLLPFTPTPAKDWQSLNLADYRAIFMHATVSGARVDHGIVLQNPGFPKLPEHVKVFSGDVHHPQQVGTVTYVGAPHPVKFGDDYATRMLVVNDVDFDIVAEIKLNPPRKLMLTIRSMDDLARLKVRKGDQVRLRLDGMGDNLAVAEALIVTWAETHGVTLAGTEVIVATSQAHGVDTTQSPETILRQFAAHEGLADDVLEVGLELLREGD